MQLIGRTTIILWLAVMLSAMGVVYSTFSARQLFVEWQNLLKIQQNQDVVWGQLLIERSALSAYARLDKIAKEKLRMSEPTPEQIHLVLGGRL